MSKILFGLLSALTIISGALGISCESPNLSATTFSTTDAFFHFTTTYIVEFTLHCANNAKDMAIYAVVNGKVYQVAVSEETSKYQVSWQLEHDQSGSQTFEVEIYDEDGYAAYRKVERSNENSNHVKPLSIVHFKHQGVSRGAVVSSETVFTLLFMGLLYYVHSCKSQLQS